MIWSGQLCDLYFRVLINIWTLFNYIYRGIKSMEFKILNYRIAIVLFFQKLSKMTV